MRATAMAAAVLIFTIAAPAAAQQSRVPGRFNFDTCFNICLNKSFSPRECQGRCAAMAAARLRGQSAAQPDPHDGHHHKNLH